jgi:osmotically-inducible protein OsmY
MKTKAALLLRRTLCSLTLLFALMTPAYSASKPVTDDFLIDTIRQKLAADPVVKGGAIDVDAKDGVVVLKGRVEEEKQKAKAEKIAKNVKGVKSVTNELQIGRPELRQ